MSKRLEDYELKSLTDAANLAAPDGNVIKALTELQERRADDARSEDIEKLHSWLNGANGERVALVVFQYNEYQRSALIKGYEYEDDTLWYQEASDFDEEDGKPIFWLPWEG